MICFAIVRFISLHEVDAWNANAPWARTVVDLVAAAGVSAVAIARLVQLSDDKIRIRTRADILLRTGSMYNSSDTQGVFWRVLMS